MKRIHLFATVAVVAVLPAIPAQAQVVGVASAVKNDVRLRKPNTTVARPVQLKQRIAIADQVQTGAKSQMQIVLLDRSIFTLGANARVTIDRYVYDPQRNNRTMGATVGRGAFRFMSGRRTGGSTTINTPTAAIGVRGTLVEGLVGEDAVLIANNERGVGRGLRADPATASLIILRGPGRGTTANVRPGVIDVSAGGRTVTVDQPMQAVYIPYPGAEPIGPFTISEAGLRQLQALLYPSVAQRLGIRGPFDPNRSFTAAPPIEEAPTNGPRRLPRRSGDYPEAGALPDDDQPPGMNVPMPLDRLRDAPPPQQRRNPPQQRAQPTAAPAPTPPANNNPNRDKPPTPTPAPTPTPTPSPAKAPANPSFVAPPTPSPTPAPTPTPSPNLKAPGQQPPNQQPNQPGKPNTGKPNDPPPKPPG